MGGTASDGARWPAQTGPRDGAVVVALPDVPVLSIFPQWRNTNEPAHSPRG